MSTKIPTLLSHIMNKMRSQGLTLQKSNESFNDPPQEKSISDLAINPLIIDKKSSSFETKTHEKAYKRGMQAARSGCLMPDISLLMQKQKYDEYEASAYIEGYGSTSGNKETQLLRRAKRAGNQAALMGYPLLTKNQLQRKNYTDAQIDCYIQAYHKAAGTHEEQVNRRIRLSAYQAAKYGCKMPTVEKLKSKLYTPEQIDIYYAAYNKAAGSENEQMLRKLNRYVYQLSRKKLPIPTKEELIQRGFNETVIDLFFETK